MPKIIQIDQPNRLEGALDLLTTEMLKIVTGPFQTHVSTKDVVTAVGVVNDFREQLQRTR